MIQNNLAAALLRQSRHLRGDKREGAVRGAVDACKAALMVHSTSAMPFQWAGTTFNLAGCFEELAEVCGDSIDYLTKSRMLAEQSASAFTAVHDPRLNPLAVELVDRLRRKISELSSASN